jgi:sugar phosphate permease
MFLVYLVAFAERANVSVAAPAMSAELQLTAAGTGIVLSAFFWGYILTQVPGGWLANKVGPSRVIAGALVIWGLTSIAQALSGSLTPLLICRFVMGLSEGVVWPSFAVMFIAWYPLSERARAAGLSLLAMPFSSVIMAPSAGWLIATWSWETMFIVQGLPAFILAVFVVIFLRDDPAKDHRLSAAERDHILAHRARRGAGGAAESFVTVLKKPVVWACCAVYFLWLTGFYSFGLWLPTVLKQLSSSGIEAVGWLSAIPFTIAGLAMLLNSRAADRSTRSKSWFVVPPLFLGAAALLLQHLLPQTLGVQMVFLVLTGLGVYAAFGPWWAWALQYVAPEQAGPASGMVNVFGSFGGIVGPIVVGYAANGGSAASGFYILGFFLLAGALLALTIARFASRQVSAVTTEDGKVAADAQGDPVVAELSAAAQPRPGVPADRAAARRLDN